MQFAKIGLLVPVFLLTACEARNLYVAHESVVGVNAQVSPDRQQGRLLIGYDRDFVTIIPKSVTVDQADSEKRDVMASLGCTRLQINGITLVGYTDMVVSGDAAIKMANNLTKKEDLFHCKIIDGEKD